jgi:hypothetical protein
MAKKKNTEKTRKVPPTIDPSLIPEGYQERTDDVKGFFNEEYGSIHFVPVEVKAMDSSQDAEKASGLIFGRLLSPCMLATKVGEETVPVQGEEGDIVGVWYKPGMRAIRNLAGEAVFMFLSGHKDVGKQNEMGVYTIMSQGQGAPLPLAEDLRKASASKPLPFQRLGAED